MVIEYACQYFPERDGNIVSAKPNELLIAYR